MNNINRAVAELLEKNRQFFDGKPIAFDGVVDEETFKKTNVKTLFCSKRLTTRA